MPTYRPASLSYNAPAMKTPSRPPLPPEIRADQSVELLQALHILTRDGKLNQDSRRKLKQVYHLYQFIEPLLTEVMTRRGNLTLADHGAGKSYLGFILYDLYLKAQTSGHIYGIETRPELIANAQDLAQRAGFERMSFLNLSAAASIRDAALPDSIDIVTALHACNTATDDAIRFALAKKAKHVVLVPCCQAEVAATLRQTKAASLATNALAELWRHPIHTREFGSLVTNVLRCLQLQSHGYQVTVTELVGWEHSMKNELIIASHTNAPRNTARKRLEEILDTLNLNALRGRFLE